MDIIRFICENCNCTIKASNQLIGKQAICSNCKSLLTVPEQSLVNQGSDEFGLAAMSVEQFSPETIADMRKEMRREMAAAAESPRKVRPQAPLVESIPDASESLPGNSNDYNVVERVRWLIRILSWMYVIYYFFLLAEIALGVEFLGLTNAMAGELAQSAKDNKLVVFAYHLLKGSTVVCFLVALAELLHVASEIAVNTRRRR